MIMLINMSLENKINESIKLIESFKKFENKEGQLDFYKAVIYSTHEMQLLMHIDKHSSLNLFQ